MSTSNTITVEIPEEALSTGIKSSRRNISMQFGLDESTVNSYIGQYDGIGPRYGMQPAPFHAVDAQDALGSVPNYLFPSSLTYSVRNNSSFWQNRTRIYGIYAVKLTQYNGSQVSSSLVSQGVTYFFIGDMQYTRPSASSGTPVPQPRVMTIGYTSNFVYDDTASPPRYYPRHGQYFDTGVVADSSMPGGSFSAPVTLNRLRLGIRTSDKFPQREFFPEPQRNYYRTAYISVSGSDIPMGSILGDNKTFSSRAASPGIWSFNAYSKQVNYGQIPPESSGYDIIILGRKAANIYWQWYYRHTYTSFTLSSGSIATAKITPDFALPRFTTSDGSLNATITTSGTATAGSEAASITRDLRFLFKSKNFVMNSSYSAFFVAKEQPVAALYQDWINQYSNYSNGSVPFTDFDNNVTGIQYFDPTTHYLSIPNRDTIGYTEDGTPKQSAFFTFPAYSSSGSLATDAIAPLDGTIYTLGEDGSGILRLNTTYELTYSIFDKSTNAEGNVGGAVKFKTGSDDFVRLSVWRQPTSGGFPAQTAPISIVESPILNNIMSNPLSGSNPFINYLEIRFYYRPLGTFEWLPAGKWDLADWYYDCTSTKRWICEGAIASLPGGQPGGINDYSSLPKEKWIDVIPFQGYVFWMSSQSMVWSNRNDAFSYPVLNSVSTPKGYNTGMLEHVYPGQSTQDSRLLMFTSEGIYAGRFNGEFQQVEVQVSPTASGTFERPGSNFQLTFWTSNIAFSSRAACVAQGALYYWGPGGVYVDIGNEIPSKNFSYQIEPLVHNIYDKSRTDEIHAVYNARTKEVIWFYPPSSGTSATKALVYNQRWDAFYIWDFGSIIVDNSQVIDVKLNRANDNSISGTRVALYIRDAVATSNPQQVVFLDEICDSGDVKTSSIAFVSAVAVQGANRRLSVLSSGVALPTSGTITVANYNGYADVAESSGDPDGLYTVVGGDGLTYIDIAPIGSWAGRDFQIGTITNVRNRFPVSWESEHGFPFRIVSQYWAARGMRAWQRWLYCYQSIKTTELLPSSSQQIRLKFYTILGTGNSERDLTLTDNSRGNMQAHSQILFTNQNAEGQALAIEWTTPSGKFNGSRWHVQYLSFDITPMQGNNFKTWEA